MAERWMSRVLEQGLQTAMERFWYVRDCDLIERLSLDEIGRLENRSRTRSFARGTAIALPDDAASSIFTLTAGRVWISRVATNGECLDRIVIDPGDWFGTRSHTGGELVVERLDVVSACTVLQVPLDATQDLLRDQPRVTMEAPRWLGLRRDRTERRLADLLFLSPRDKLILWLLRLAAHHAEPWGEGVRFLGDLPRGEIATATGSTREDVEVAWLELRLKNELRYELGKLVIVNRSRFENLVTRNAARSPRHYASRRSA